LEKRREVEIRGKLTNKAKTIAFVSLRSTVVEIVGLQPLLANENQGDFVLYLFGAILSSFSIGMIIKYTETKQQNTVVVLFFNYLVATGFSIAIALMEGSFSIGESTLFLGTVGGLLWPLSFFMLMRGIRAYGVSLTGALARLSLVVPVAFAVLFLGETFSWQGLLGLLLTFCAFFMISPIRTNKLSGMDFSAAIYLGLLILMLGTTDVWMNIFKIHGTGSERTMFLTLVFGVAAALMGLVICLRKLPVSREAVLSGLILGLPNYFSSFLLLEALKADVFHQQSALVYSLYSASILVLTFIAGVLFWKERVRRISYAGALIAVAAIVLLNLAR